MKTMLPVNTVSYPYVETLQDFVTNVVKTQGDNLLSVFLTGSYARGDATPESDMDVWCVFSFVDFEVLSQVGECVKPFREAKPSIEINPQCFSLSETFNPHFDGWIESPVKVLDAVLIYGNDYFDVATTIDALEKLYIKAAAVSVAPRKVL